MTHQKKETLSRNRTYAFRRVHLTPRKQEQQENLSCLYIGRNFREVFPMVNGFTTVSNAIDFKPAIHTISRLAATPNAYSVVLFDASLPVSELKEFLDTLKNFEFFSRLTIIGDVRNCSREQMLQLRRVQHVDDLILLDDKDLLKQKTDFYQKLKHSNQEAPATARVETRMSVPKLSLVVLQRTFDLLFSSLLLVVLAPVFAILAMLIRMESAGSVIIVAEGRGSRYQRFRFFKFRTTATIQVNKISDLQLENYSADQQVPLDLGEVHINRMGHFLKSTNLDELPSLVNVLLGDISFLGNRMA